MNTDSGPGPDPTLTLTSIQIRFTRVERERVKVTKEEAEGATPVAFDLLIWNELAACEQSRSVVVVEEEESLDATDAIGTPVTFVRKNSSSLAF